MRSCAVGQMKRTLVGIFNGDEELPWDYGWGGHGGETGLGETREEYRGRVKCRTSRVKSTLRVSVARELIKRVTGTKIAIKFANFHSSFLQIASCHHIRHNIHIYIPSEYNMVCRFCISSLVRCILVAAGPNRLGQLLMNNHSIWERTDLSMNWTWCLA